LKKEAGCTALTGGSRLLESDLCFNRAARVQGRDGSDEKLRGAWQQKIAFYGHPSRSHAYIGGCCLLLLLSPHSPSLPLKQNRWT